MFIKNSKFWLHIQNSNHKPAVIGKHKTMTNEFNSSLSNIQRVPSFKIQIQTQGFFS
uniref:Uncharacterized protein n=1 Tax=Helianthus annuus TaxID=4232 RepID=A0A251UYP6_HELAN